MAVDDGYTVALLHMDGTDASTTFTDESGKAWTANGNAQIDTAQSVFGGASGLFDGTGDYILASDSDDWQLDGGSNSNSWTVDFRVRFNGDPSAGNRGLVQQYLNVNNWWCVYFGVNTIKFIVRNASSTTVTISNAFDPATATWYHIAVVKDGTNGYMMFVNGTQIGTTQTNTNPIPNIAGGTLRLGLIIGAGGNAFYHNGWMDELRISKGIARWTSDFTPPSAAYGETEEIANNNFFMFF